MKIKKHSGLAETSNDHQARILSAASAIFLEKGYGETSTAEIARRAKVSKRELYSNFNDKRDILAAVIAHLQSEIQVRANVIWSSDQEVRTVLIEAGTQILSFINSEKFGKLLRIVAAESFHDPVTAREFYRLGPGAGREDTAAFLRLQMKSGALRKADPLQAAEDFLNLVVSAQNLAAVVLGQSQPIPRPIIHVRHAVDVFLSHYGTATASPSGKPSAPIASAAPSGTPGSAKPRAKADAGKTRARQAGTLHRHGA